MYYEEETLVWIKDPYFLYIYISNSSLAHSFIISVFSYLFFYKMYQPR